MADERGQPRVCAAVAALLVDMRGFVKFLWAVVQLCAIAALRVACLAEKSSPIVSSAASRAASNFPECFSRLCTGSSCCTRRDLRQDTATVAAAASRSAKRRGFIMWKVLGSLQEPSSESMMTKPVV